VTPVRFTLTDDLLIDAARLHNKGKWPRFGVIYGVSAAMIGILLAFASGDHSARATLEGIAFLGGAALATSIIMFFVTRYWTIPRRVKRALSHFDPADLLWEVGWNETHLQVQTGDGHSSVKFSRLAGWKPSPFFLLVYRTDESYYVFPRAAFDEAGALDALIDKLRAASVLER
jgi:hypothetical protein